MSSAAVVIGALRVNSTCKKKRCITSLKSYSAKEANKTIFLALDLEHLRNQCTKLDLLKTACLHSA